MKREEEDDDVSWRKENPFVPNGHSLLYGRELEEKKLVEIYERIVNSSGKKIFVMITGEVGVGKTHLAQVCMKRCLGDGFLLRGRFDPFHEQAEPFRSVMDGVLQSLWAQVPTPGSEEENNHDFSDSDQEVIKALTAVKYVERQSISSVVLRLEQRKKAKLKDATTTTTSGEEPFAVGTLSMERFVSFAPKVLQAVASVKKQPIVTLIDDMQWASTDSSLDLSRFIISETKGPALVIGTCRHDMSESLREWMQEMKRDNHVDEIHHIHLNHLTRQDVQNMAEGSILVEKKATDIRSKKKRDHQVSLLTEALFDRCHGNPYCAMELLHHLEKEQHHQKQQQKQERHGYGSEEDSASDGFHFQSGLLIPPTALSHSVPLSNEASIKRYSNEKTKTVPVDATEMLLQSLPCEVPNLVSYCRQKLEKLPEETLEVLKVVSCFGFMVELTFLSFALSMAPESILALLGDDESIITLCHIYPGNTPVLFFPHNCMRETIYGLIDNKSSFHFDIAQRLLQGLLSQREGKPESARQREPQILQHFTFFVVLQIRLAVPALKGSKQRLELAVLCHEQGAESGKRSNFPEASCWLDLGLSLLEERVSWRDQYDLTLAMHNAAAEMAYAQGDPAKVHVLIEEVLRHARNTDDSISALAMKVYSLGSTGKAREALSVGLDVLQNKLGERVPDHPNPMHILWELTKTRRMLRGKTPESLLRLPVMKDPIVLSKMKILALTVTNTFLTSPNLSPILSFRMLQLTLKHGLCSISATAFSIYGKVLCSILGNPEEGVRFGQLALEIIDKFRSRQWLPRVQMVVSVGITPWVRTLESSLEPLKQAYRIGLSTGDLECSMMIGNIYVFLLFGLGRPVPLLRRETAGLAQEMKVLGQNAALSLNKPLAAAMDVLSLDADEAAYRNFMGNDGNSLEDGGDMSFFAGFMRVLVAVVFHDFRGALAEAEKSRCLSKKPAGGIEVSGFMCLDALAILAHYRNNNKKKLRPARFYLRRLKEFAKHNPRFCLGKVYLLQAEFAAISANRHVEACQYYESAIALAARSQLLMDEAIATERAGRYMLQKGHHVQGMEYLVESMGAYQKWGARAKVQRLQQEFDIAPTQEEG